MRDLRTYIERRFKTINEDSQIREGTIWCEKHHTMREAIERMLDFADQLPDYGDEKKAIQHKEEQFFQFLGMYILDNYPSSINVSAQYNFTKDEE